MSLYLLYPQHLDPNVIIILIIIDLFSDSESYSYSLFIYGSSVDREYFVRDMEALFSDVYGENVTVLIIETSNYYTPDTGWAWHASVITIFFLMSCFQ